MERGELAGILALEASLRPVLEPCDVYKLAYQSVMGADHLLRVPRERAEACFKAEWEQAADLEAVSTEPAVQLLDPGAGTCRLHLGALRRMKADPASVAEAILGQPPKNGTLDDLATLWNEIISLGELLPPPMSASELAGYELPPGAPHHSPAYGRVSYRVANSLARLSIIRFL
jgi:hypothetical protein